MSAHHGQADVPRLADPAGRRPRGLCVSRATAAAHGPRKLEGITANLLAPRSFRGRGGRRGSEGHGGRKWGVESGEAWGGGEGGFGAGKGAKGSQGRRG